LTLSMTRGWNTVFVPTNDNITRDSIENFCGSVRIFSIESKKLIIENGLYGGDSYLVRTERQCSLKLNKTRATQDSIEIGEGWNIAGTQTEITYSDIASVCGSIQIFTINKGRLISVKDGDILRKDNAYLIRSGSDCTYSF
ncbi:MAG: hypothetical protein JW716_04740, partial [Candidatus Aenigmarchaeota archaeon]|nr:hypothetical protein [Candidatus Aenigmarchaeota archaeon]